MTPAEARLSAHQSQSYADRTRTERAICAFLGAKGSEPAWCISHAEVQQFIASSRDYAPLVAALKEAVSYAR